MEQNKVASSLNDLRSENINKSDEILFEKSLFGGYNKKSVTEYIKILKEDLQNAERLFNERLEEYASMSSMLTQERDKYIKIVKDNDAVNSALKDDIELLKKENEDLNIKIKELSENVLDQNEVDLYIQTLSENGLMKTKIEELENKLEGYTSFDNENSNLKDSISQLELKIADLNSEIENHSVNDIAKENIESENIALKDKISNLEMIIDDLNIQIEDYAKNEVLKEEYDLVLAENDTIKQQYDEIMTEKSIVLAQKNVLAEQNKRMSESLIQANEKIKELREINTKIKLKTRRMTAEFETKIYECSENHQKNIEKITDNITNALTILNYESMDIQKLITGNDELLFLEEDEENESEI